MPKRPNTAKRWFAEDLGFSSREIVFTDTYARRLKPDAKGVVVALIRPQSAAQSGGLQMNDMITELNREPVTDVDAFRKAYEAFRKDKPKEAVVMVVLREGQHADDPDRAAAVSAMARFALGLAELTLPRGDRSTCKPFGRA